MEAQYHKSTQETKVIFTSSEVKEIASAIAGLKGLGLTHPIYTLYDVLIEN